jgi:hypothetical protein
MRTVYPNQTVTYTVQIRGAGGALIPSVLSNTLLNVNAGADITATSLGQNIYGNVPAGTTAGDGTLRWRWTQTVYGNVTQQDITENVLVADPGDQTNSVTSLSTAYREYTITPSISENTLPDPGIFYWGVKAQLRDAQNTVISESPESALFQFLLDSEETGLIPSFGGPGGTTYSPLLQNNPLVPEQTFRLLGVLPFPGYVNQDSAPQAD